MIKETTLAFRCDRQNDGKTTGWHRTGPKVARDKRGICPVCKGEMDSAIFYQDIGEEMRVEQYLAWICLKECPGGSAADEFRGVLRGYGN